MRDESPVARCGKRGGAVSVCIVGRSACVAQLVEHFLGKEEVTGSIPVASSTKSIQEERRDIVVRDIITLECTDCKRRNYSTTKNKKKHSGRVEFKKFCRFCGKHTVHKETR